METPVKILVVDDEMPICELMKINLELAGFSVDIANSAEEALQKHLADYALMVFDIMMGEISGRLADYSILTSDNPRTENPYEILAAVEEGIKRTKGEYVVIENRREAIRHALQIGREGDIIVLAGKGHETYQEIMGVKRPFDEKVMVRELLEEMSREA